MFPGAHQLLQAGDKGQAGKSSALQPQEGQLREARVRTGWGNDCAVRTVHPVQSLGSGRSTPPITCQAQSTLKTGKQVGGSTLAKR